MVRNIGTMDIEKLILCVKKYPMLYDSDHRDFKSMKHKDHIWIEIGEELQENGEELKKKWKNLRDCYARYIRAWDIKTLHTAPYSTRFYKFWPWAKHMEIFKPYLKFAKGHTEIEQLNESADQPTTTTSSIPNNVSPSNASDENDDHKTQDYDIPHNSSQKTAAPKATPPPPPTTTLRNKRKCTTESSVDKVLKYLKRKKSKVNSSSNNFSATEHLFLGFAKTIETFSPRRQSSVKMKIAKMVLEEELFEREEQEESEHQDQGQLQSTITLNEDGEDKKIFEYL